MLYLIVYFIMIGNNKGNWKLSGIDPKIRCVCHGYYRMVELFDVS